jgi:hypothetical protein
MMAGRLRDCLETYVFRDQYGVSCFARPCSQPFRRGSDAQFSPPAGSWCPRPGCPSYARTR